MNKDKKLLNLLSLLEKLLVNIEVDIDYENIGNPFVVQTKGTGYIARIVVHPNGYDLFLLNKEEIIKDHKGLKESEEDFKLIKATVIAALMSLKPVFNNLKKPTI